jgi:hypothetical protein
MQPNPVVFKLRDSSHTGCFTLGVMFFSFFLLLFGTPLFRGQFMFLIPVLALAATLSVREWYLVSKIKATIDNQQLALEMLRLGFGAKDVAGVFLWQDLRGFAFGSGGRGGPTLRLEWADGTEHFFRGADIYPFRNYLRQHFPALEKK